ncbi:MAG TPA: hypothetical protein VEH00_07755 [Steroidobacteraceae bacterium]|nr:hypothetical protein [Steroidobacteraceae bacterium]
MIQKIVVYVLIVLLSTGCTTLRPIGGSPSELQQRINSGELLRVGDRVEVVTSDGNTHRIIVTKLGDGRIEGGNESISVERIVSLQKREFSGGKTLALIGAAALAVLLGIGVSQASHPNVSL